MSDEYSYQNERDSLNKRLADIDTAEIKENYLRDKKERDERMFNAKISELKEQRASNCQPLKSLMEEKKGLILENETAKSSYGDLKIILEDCLSDLQKKKDEVKKKIKECERGPFDSITQVKECPICFDELLPPKQIYQCPEGHILCGECRVGISSTNCSTCRADVGSGGYARNRELEAMYANLGNLSLEDKISALTRARETLADLKEELRGIETQRRNVNTPLTEAKQAFEQAKLKCDEKLAQVEEKIESLRKKNSQLDESVKSTESQLKERMQSFQTDIDKISSSAQEEKLQSMKALQLQLEKLSLKEDVDYRTATEFAFLEISVDGEKFPRIKMFLTGKQNPNAVATFSSFCNGSYKDSKIDWVDKSKKSISGGRYKKCGGAIPTTARPQEADSTRTRTPGDVALLWKPGRGIEARFYISATAGEWGSDMMRVGRVVNPGAVEAISSRGKLPVGKTVGDISNSIIIEDSGSYRLQYPVIIPM